MLNHPYAAEILAAQHRRELQASADQVRLARQATTRPRPHPDLPARRADHRGVLWPNRHHRRPTTANPA